MIRRRPDDSGLIFVYTDPALFEQSTYRSLLGEKKVTGSYTTGINLISELLDNKSASFSLSDRFSGNLLY